MQGEKRKQSELAAYDSDAEEKEEEEQRCGEDSVTAAAVAVVAMNTTCTYVPPFLRTYNFMYYFPFC